MRPGSLSVSATADHDRCHRSAVARLPVDIGGPENTSAIVIFDNDSRSSSAYTAVRQRLHIATFRTVLVESGPHLTAKSAISLLDALGVKAAVLVGDCAGGTLAWQLAATYQDRFTGLVVIDSGHPRVPDVNGMIPDKYCPSVYLDTTALVSSRTADAVARASKRYVHGEFRLKDLAGWRGSRHFTSQLTTEILLRRHSWPG